MAFYTITYQSPVLGGEGEYGVFIPDRPCGEDGYPVLWLLHGAFGDYAQSLLYSPVIGFCNERNIAVVAPTSYLGVYTDMVYGEKGYSFVEEVFDHAPELFKKLSAKKEDNAVMGISMGGHGAYKLTLARPDRICGCIGFSSPLDMVYTMTLLETGRHGGGHELYDAFGSSAAYAGSKGDVLSILRRKKEAGEEIPRLFLGWGSEDHARFEDMRFVDELNASGIPVRTKVMPGGHEFTTWNPMMEEAIDYVFGKEEPLC